MKSILLAPLPPPAGGIASWTLRMLNAELKNNWTVTVVDEKLINRANHGDKNKKNLFIEAYRCFKIWTELCKKLVDKDARIVHACTPATATAMARDLVCCFITHLFRRKFVIHFRCTISNLVSDKRVEKMCKLICKHSDMVYVLNKASLDYVNSITDTRCELIPNFFDVSKLPLTEKVYNKDLKSIVYTGGVTLEKGCGEIIEVAKKLPQFNFRLIGNIRQEILDMEVPENVTLTGPVSKDEVYEELNKADLYIFFTHMNSEGFANSLVEAMAFGIPCIVTDWSANMEMIENKGGMVLPIHDIAGLEKAILEMQSVDVRRKYGEWNSQKVLNCYSEKVICERYIDTYESIL